MRLRLLGLALAFAGSRASAEPAMLLASSPHFRIYSTQPEADLRGLCDELERYDATLRRATGTAADDGAVPLTVYIASDATSGGLGNGVLGYYEPAAAGPFAVVPARVRGYGTATIPRIVLFHEYAHHFMLQTYPTLYSTWFVEGFAEFYSTVEVGAGTSTIGKPEPLRIRTLLRPGQATLSTLISGRALTAEQTGDLYARAWLLVHYLTLSKTRGGQISDYLRARSSGKSEADAFRIAFHVSIDAMNSELRTYFKAGELGYAVIDVPAAPVVTVRPATAGETAIARLVPRLRNAQALADTQDDVTRTHAHAIGAFDRDLASDARAAARKLPDDGDVRIVEAESTLIAGQPDQAAAAAAAAVRLAPGNPRAHLAVAAAAMAALQPDDHGALAAARKEIVVANRLAPDDPMPLIAYYRSFADHGETPPPIAVKGLERAEQLAPEDDGVRVMLASEEIRLGHRTYAADLLRPVALSPHASTRRDAAKALLTSLPDDGEPSAPPPRP